MKQNIQPLKPKNIVRSAYSFRRRYYLEPKYSVVERSNFLILASRYCHRDVICNLRRTSLRQQN